ncbi:alpha/beta fold hydrolase [uncultured Hymenobacter sp.]|uniref:alpha/beta fold hydrolase n=1 Tax=uncultured Hymenobacter sp. TaxID=170016 RepID=UPI0035CBB331
MEAGWKSSKQVVNGLTLHVVEAGPVDGSLLILLHGFPEFWWAWRHQITPFAEAGYRVVVPDLRGYNQSEAPEEVSAYRLDRLVADVLALADHYEAERFYLVGHDWGGIIAWGVGASHSDRLRRLVVMDAPHPDLWAEQAFTHPTQALRSTYVAVFQLPWLPETALSALDFAGLRAMVESTARADAFKPGELEQYIQAWDQGSLTAMLNYYRALREREKPAQPTRIQVPTLVLWGEHDSFLEHHVAYAARDLCDHGHLVIIEGATHWLHLEEPARVNAEIIGFLNSDG